jgi:hypothetical protein
MQIVWAKSGYPIDVFLGGKGEAREARVKLTASFVT